MSLGWMTSAAMMLSCSVRVRSLTPSRPNTFLLFFAFSSRLARCGSIWAIRYLKA
jgi:hypothetical protein